MNALNVFPKHEDSYLLYICMFAAIIKKRIAPLYKIKGLLYVTKCSTLELGD